MVYIPGSKPSLSTTCIDSVLVNRRADDRVVVEVIACAPVKEVLASESESRRAHGSRTAVAANVDPIGSSCSPSALAASCSVIGVTCRAIESRCCSARFSTVALVTRVRLERGDIGVTGEFGSSCTQIVGVLILEIIIILIQYILC